MGILNEKALLASLKISMWTAKKYDRKATQTVTEKHNLKGDVGRYNKSLFPHVDGMLKSVVSKGQQIREQYYANTVPWGIDGTMMLPTANYLEFMQKFGTLRGEWEQAVSNFLTAYPDMKEKAKAILGDLYNEADYPSLDAVRGKFNMELTILPVPGDDIRCNLVDEEVEKIRAGVDAKVKAAAEAANRELWDRLYQRVEAISNKLSDPSAIFRNSLIDNAKELCDLLKRLNVTDDPELEAMRQRVQDDLVVDDVDALRRDPDVRKEVAEDAKDIVDDIMDKMGAMYGR